MPFICKALSKMAMIPAIAILLSSCIAGPTGVIIFDLSDGNIVKITAGHFQTLDQGFEDCELVVYNLNVAETSGPAVGILSNLSGDDGHVGFVQWQEGNCFGADAQFRIGEQSYNLEADFAPKNFPKEGEVTGQWFSEDGRQGPFTDRFASGEG